MTHCDDYIDDEAQPACLRRFLRWSRWPAHYQVRARRFGIHRPPLYATTGRWWWKRRVRVVFASRMGDVGVTDNLVGLCGYEERMMLTRLRDFAVTM